MKSYNCNQNLNPIWRQPLFAILSLSQILLMRLLKIEYMGHKEIIRFMEKIWVDELNLV